MGQEYVEKYNKYASKKTNEETIALVIQQLQLINERCQIDEKIVEIVDTLLLFYHKNVLQNVNKETLDLLSKILGNNSGKYFPDDFNYFCRYLKIMLLPSSIGENTNSDALAIFFAETDIFLNLIMQNLTIDDINSLKKYNSILWEIIIRCKTIEQMYASNPSNKNFDTANAMLLDNTIAHSATILYHSIGEFDYEYDLLIKLYERIMANIEGFIIECCSNGIYADRFCFATDSDNVLNEYIMCKKLLEREYRPPIKIYKNGGDYSE